VVAQVHRLGTLQVCIAGHRPVEVPLGQGDQRAGDALGLLAGADRMGTHEHGHIGRHLVVARARRVQLSPNPAGQLRDAALDCHVNVLVALRVWELAVGELVLHLVERVVELVALVARDDARGRQHARVRA